MTYKTPKYTCWVVWDSKKNIYQQHDGTFGIDKGARRFGNPVAALSSCALPEHRAVEVEFTVQHLRVASVTLEPLN